MKGRTFRPLCVEYWKSGDIRSEVIQFKMIKVGQKTFSLPVGTMEYNKSNTRSGAPSVFPLVRMASLNSCGKMSIQFQTAALRCTAMASWDSFFILTSNDESSVNQKGKAVNPVFGSFFEVGKNVRLRSNTNRSLSRTLCDINCKSTASGFPSGCVAKYAIFVDKRSNTTFQFEAEIWKIILPTYLAIRLLTDNDDLTSDICVFSYAGFVAAMCVVDLMLTRPDRTELADGRLRRGISEGAGGCTFAMLTVSSKSRNETSVVRVCSMRGTSDEAVCRMNRTMTLRMYFTHESSSGGGSCHDGAVECTDGAPCGSLLLGTGESGADNG